MTAAGAELGDRQPARGRLGIVTDRDIRTKIVAAGLPLSAPVATVMTTPVFTVPPDRLGGEVLFELLERGIRHAPVVSESGQLLGVIEDADLLAAPNALVVRSAPLDLPCRDPGGPGGGGRAPARDRQ